MIIRWCVYIIVTIFMLFMEIWTLYLWLIKKYLPPKKITFSRFKNHLKEFYAYKRKINKNEIVPSDSMDIFLNENKEKYGSFISGVIFLGMVLLFYALTCSLFFVGVLLFISKHAILLGLSLLALEVVLFRILCWKLCKLVIEWLDDFNSFLFDFRRMLHNEKTKGVNAHNRIYDMVASWVALVLSIVIVIAISVLLKKNNIDWRMIFNLDYKQNSVMFIALLCIIGSFLVLLYFRERKSIKGNKGIIFHTKLTPWENDIEKICSKLHIKNIEINVIDNNQTVYSILKKYEIPQICIGDYFLENLKNNYNRETFYYMVLFILGHELSHISSKDSYNRGKFKLLPFHFIGMLLYLFVLREIHLAFYSIIDGLLFWIIFDLLMVAFALFTYVFFYKTWSDERYWKQVYELRADRIGLQVSNISVALFKKLMFYFQTRIETEEDFHPLYETRVKEIEKYKNMKWGIKDQLRYTFKFAWNLRIYKEWRL